MLVVQITIFYISLPYILTICSLSPLSYYTPR